jgi:hypothetical protein
LQKSFSGDSLTSGQGIVNERIGTLFKTEGSTMVRWYEWQGTAFKALLMVNLIAATAAGAWAFARALTGMIE